MKIVIELSVEKKPDPLAWEQLCQWAMVIEGSVKELPVPAFLKPKQEQPAENLQAKIEEWEGPAQGNGEMLPAEPEPRKVNPLKFVKADISKDTRVETPWGNKMTAQSAAERAGFSFTTLKTRFAKGGTLEDLYAPAVRGRKPAARAPEPEEPEEDLPSHPLAPVADAVKAALPPGVVPPGVLPPGVQKPATPTASPVVTAELQLRDQVRQRMIEAQKVDIMLPSDILTKPAWADGTEKPVWQSLPSVDDIYLKRLYDEIGLRLATL